MRDMSVNQIVDIADEMVAMLQAVRTYEANVSASEMNKTISKKALEISKGSNEKWMDF